MHARRFDLVCMGRAAVDLYGEQIGGRLEDMHDASPSTSAARRPTPRSACARLGLKPAMLTRVGDEHNGRFVRETLAREGVDVSHVTTDPKRLTALVFLGIRDRDTLPAALLPRPLRRHGARARRRRSGASSPRRSALLLSGTHLSQPQTLRGVPRARSQLARAAGARVVLDIDYRPVLWGLTAPGLGEQRYVAVGPGQRAACRRSSPTCDLIVGTEEEIRIAGGSTDTLRRAAPPARADARRRSS